MERIPNFLKNVAVGASRSVFAICPKDNTLPKCDGCFTSIKKGVCPLGRPYVPAKAVRVFNKYAFACSDSEDDIPEILERITNMDMPKGTTHPDPKTLYVREIIKRKSKTKS